MNASLVSNTKPGCASRGRKRVLVVAYGRADRLCGYSHRIKELTRALAEGGHDVVLLWFTAFYRAYACHQFDALRAVATVVIRPTLPIGRIRGSSVIGRWICSRAIAREASRRAIDIVQAETILAAGLVLRARTNLPLVVDLHGDQVPVWRAQRYPEWSIRQIERDTVAACREAAGFVVVSDCLKNKIRVAANRPDLPFCVVPCGVATERFALSRLEREEMRQKLGVRDRFVLCYCGGLDSWQCIGETLALVTALMRRNPQVCFMLMTKDDLSPWRVKLGQLGQDGRDYLVINADPGMVPRYLVAADCGLLIRRQDPVNEVASPTKLGEYLAAGIPVVTTRFAGDASTIIASTGCGIVTDDVRPSDSELSALEQFIRRTMERREAVAVECRAIAEKEQNWSTVSQRLLAMVDSLAATTQGRGV